ncbi:hypothetical protein CsatA_029939 [Cannabis sativa]
MGSNNGAIFNTGLDLGLGNSQYHKEDDHEINNIKIKKLICLRYDHILPSLTLGTSSSSSSDHQYGDHHHHTAVDQVHDHDLHGVRPGANYSLATVSSLSNSSTTTLKRERSELGGSRGRGGSRGSGGDEFEVEVELERFSGSRVSTNDELLDEDQASPRKKLRLTKQQSALLEDSFKEHNTLNPKQKQDLARKLNLRPRQVEVWFQNRRARTKLKQTEADYELMKKCCESLTEENKRLQREVEELKAVKLTAAPFLLQFPSTSTATLTICPSCTERICSSSGTSNGGGSSHHHDNDQYGSANSFLKINGAKPHHHNNSFSNPFIATINSSAAY